MVWFDVLPGFTVKSPHKSHEVLHKEPHHLENLFYITFFQKCSVKIRMATFLNENDLISNEKSCGMPTNIWHLSDNCGQPSQSMSQKLSIKPSVFTYLMPPEIESKIKDSPHIPHSSHHLSSL